MYVCVCVCSTVFAVFESLTAFKNYDNGFWFRYACATEADWRRSRSARLASGDHALVTKSKFADNAVAITMPGSDNILQDSVVVGDSDNVGMPHCAGLCAVSFRCVLSFRFHTGSFARLRDVGSRHGRSHTVAVLIHTHIYMHTLSMF